MNISDQMIDTVYLSFRFYDVSGAEIASVDEHIMTMLDVPNNQTFGEKFPFYITDTRAAEAKISTRP